MAAARLQLVKNFFSRVRVIPGQILKLIGLKDADAESPWAEAYQGGGGTGVLSPNGYMMVHALLTCQKRLF